MKIHFYSKEIDEKLKSDEQHINTANNINIGNLISVYERERERDLFRFLIKPSVLAIFLHELIQKNNSILTIVDLGCGNGTNSRIIAKGIFDSLGLGIKVNVVYMDVSSDLLKESDKRSIEFQRAYKNFSWELIQIDFNNKNHLSQFANDYNEIADFVFSIKFLHNVNLKINKDIANFIASITKNNGFFLNQFYIRLVAE